MMGAAIVEGLGWYLTLIWQWLHRDCTYTMILHLLTQGLSLCISGVAAKDNERGRKEGEVTRDQTARGDSADTQGTEWERESGIDGAWGSVIETETTHWETAAMGWDPVLLSPLPWTNDPWYHAPVQCLFPWQSSFHLKISLILGWKTA